MKKITLCVAFFLGAITITKAQVIATGAYSVGVGPLTISDVTNDEDNGDGLNDGAKFIDGTGEGTDEAVYFTFDGTLEDGESYTVNTTVYNPNNSYCDITVSLYNKTDGTELATIGAGLQGVNHVSGDDIKAVELNYTAVASDAGDVLEVRFVKIQAGSYRNYAIDILQLGGVAVGPTVVSPDGSWSGIGDVELTNVTNDADNGDGVADGAIFVDGKSVVIGQGAAFTFDEAMTEGTSYNVVTNVYNSGGSYNKVIVSLYNVTDAVELTTSGTTNLPGGGTVAEISISYTALATDEGDTLELRFVKDFDGNTSRDFSIDNVTVSGSVISTSLAALSIDSSDLSEDVSVYPNPVKDVLYINEGDSVIKNSRLIDVTGKVIFQGSFTNSMNVANYTRGVYFLTLEFENGTAITKTVILK